MHFFIKFKNKGTPGPKKSNSAKSQNIDISILSFLFFLFYKFKKYVI